MPNLLNNLLEAERHDPTFIEYWPAISNVLIRKALQGGSVPQSCTLNGTVTVTKEEFIAKMKSLGGQEVCRKEWGNQNTELYVAVGFDDGYLEYSVNTNVGVVICTNLVTTDTALFDRFKAFGDLLGKPEAPGRVHMIMATSSGPKVEMVGIAGVALERGNYTDQVLTCYDKIVADLKSNKPNGRLAILNGTQGTGKTHLIQALFFDAKDCIHIIIPASMVAQVGSPELLPMFLELKRDELKKPLCLVIEDADECIVSREDGHMGSISALLNLCDGILGSLLDVRVVCTTNAKRIDMDKALLRPGRLSANVEVEALDLGQAEKVLERLGCTTELSKASYTLAELYQLASQGTTQAMGITEVSKGKMGF